ncbi:coenzyme A pyrophosphatase [Cellulomonas hominis]|uniref:8-oxo-dGTP pyrophosphatase MutT (NUDIX family) n=1 Tax=Cellulomonas hominis TaxID=156981 RepID=A0A511FA29_9CELL|nr:8-oxo-dGTP pyrophosphatase MutT (NUDIX family) [Cellulomonas hominis]GEL46139.1 coenzyme A pyrophosphatase [Cellulomonas hominis]
MTDAGALRDLLALCDARPVWAPDPERAFDGGLPGRPVRSSAVLVLFGALDRAAARTPHPAVAADLDVLLTRRSPTLRHHPGQVSFPGGGIDPGDAGPEAAALREAREETGLDPAGVRVLGALPPLPVTASRNLVTPVLAWWDRPSAVAAADPAETVDVFRVPVADLVEPANRVTATVRRAGHEYRGPAFDAGGVLVWGFTAFVLDRLLDALGWAVPWDAGRTVPAPV